MQDKNQFQVRITEKEKQQIENQTKKLVQILESLTKLNVKESKISTQSIKRMQTFFELDSKITHDVDTISSFFPKKIKGMNLLFRASENNFQVSKFHDKCDDKQHTITILKTQFGNIIGGYTPLSWSRKKNKIIKQTIVCSHSYFHQPTNINCNQSKESRKKLQSIMLVMVLYLEIMRLQQLIRLIRIMLLLILVMPYNCNNEYNGNQQSHIKFSGQSSGYMFKIQEWQVHTIVFA